MSCMVTGRAFECGGDDGDERRLGEALLSKDPVKEMSSSCSFCCLPLDDDENKPFILQLDTILSSCIQSMKCRAAAVMERENEAPYSWCFSVKFDARAPTNDVIFFIM